MIHHKPELYISIDIETDGPCPGLHSMLSIGAAAFYDGVLMETFSLNLEALPEATAHPDTMAWWATQGEAWAACRKDLHAPKEAMSQFYMWVDSLANRKMTKPVAVCYPAGFDWPFIHYYAFRFLGRYSSFGFQCIDIKSYAAAQMGVPYRQATKRHMPRHWFKDLPPHTHVAVDDAIEQGYLFINMLKDAKAGV